jgi:alanine dehydrogenase
MGRKIKIGILRETKKPPDRRVPFTPEQITTLRKTYPLSEFFIQPSDIRCFSDDEYKAIGVPLSEDLSFCDILIGIKEVDPATFIAGKTYMFFAHVGKRQHHNRDMFLKMSEKGITLVDYEYLLTDTGERIVAFGRWAGIVGAYNGLIAYGIRTGRFSLKPASQCHDLKEMWSSLKNADPEPGLKIVLTGEGRVAGGAVETLSKCRIKQVTPEDFLNKEFGYPVFCQIGPQYYTSHRNGYNFSFTHFMSYPAEYQSSFLPFARAADILITGHYWDPGSPVLFTKEDMREPGFRISVIADISCDVNGSVPSTIRTTSISDPFYGYDPVTELEDPQFWKKSVITVMAVDNLPGELPRDSSVDFGRQLMKKVMNELINGSASPIIDRATILRDGKLTPKFSYLSDYLNFTI